MTADRRSAARLILTVAVASLALAGCHDASDQASRPAASVRFQARTHGTPDELWTHIEALDRKFHATEAEDPEQVRTNVRAFAEALIPTAEALLADRRASEETRYQAADKLLATLAQQLDADPAAMTRFLETADRVRTQGRGTKIATMVDHTEAKVLRDVPEAAFPDQQARFHRIADATLRFGKAEPAPPDTAEQLLQTGRFAAGLGDNRLAFELFDLLARRFPSNEQAGFAAGIAHRLGLEGQPIGEFRGLRLDDQATMFDLKDLRGKVVLINFWASGPPSVQELPELKALRDRYGPRGFEILGVCLDPNLGRGRQFVLSGKVPWPQILPTTKPGAFQPELAQRFGVEAIPLEILVDRDGTLITSSHVLSRIVPEIEKRLPPPEKAD
jgi:phosphoglycolate phosphatase-like HAD superfamily hydrolase